MRESLKLRPKSLLLLALTASFVAVLSEAQAVITQSRVIQEPNVVGAQSATLSIQFVSPVNAPGSSTITLTVPE